MRAAFRGAVVVLAAWLTVACEADRPVVTHILRGAQPSACDRFAAIGPDAFNRANREQSIDNALCWIERNSGYRDLPPPYQWLELTPQHIAGLSVRTAAGASGGSATALYNCRAAALYFRKDIDLGKIHDQSVLVHELVHHAQCVNQSLSNTPDRACANETEAYGLQARFVRSQAEPLSDTDARHRLFGEADAMERIARQFCDRLRQQRR